MSVTLWSDHLVPAENAIPGDYDPDFYATHGIRVPNALPLPIENTDIDIPDRRAYRSMSRAAVLMSAVCLKAAPLLTPFLSKDPFSVGLYASIDGGPIDYPSTHELGLVGADEFFEKYKKLRTPKMYLRQLPNLAPAQIGIFLGIQGPMCVYNHSTAGSLQALEQAEMDLQEGVVEAALVCTGFSFEDSLQTMRARSQAPDGAALSEGSAALLLTRGQGFRDWKRELEKSTTAERRYYGISQPIIVTALTTRRKQDGTERAFSPL